MAAFEGLVWKAGDDGWKTVPVGIGATYQDGDVENDDAALRVEDGLVAGYGGKTIDFKNANELLSACPAEDGPLKILWAGVHPTNLKAAIIVWSAPVVILDPSKVGGGGASVNGRIMTVPISGVKIDGSDAASVHIGNGAVGSYRLRPDPGAASVPNTLSGMYAATANDTAAGTGQTGSQTAGKDISSFTTFSGATVQVKVSMKYKMEDAKQSCGEPHKIWGACYCIWGTTCPMESFPYGTTMDIDPADLSPPSGFYGGVVASDSFVDRGGSFDIAVAGVAGPVVKVPSINHRELPFQPGQAVAFETYRCETVCDTEKMTKVAEIDEALAYVDEDIIKPSERTFPVYTFLETTYYMTTMYAITTMTAPAYTTTVLKTDIVSTLWQGTNIYDTAMKWETDIALCGYQEPVIDVNRISIILNGMPDGSAAVSGEIVKTSIGVADLVVCGPGGSTTTLKVLTVDSGSGFDVVIDVPTMASEPFSQTGVLTAASNFVIPTIFKYDPKQLEVTKFSALKNITAFTDDGTDLTLLKPKPDDELFTFAVINTEAVIPILDTTGPEDKAVKLLISNTDGTMSMIGMTDPLYRTNTLRIFPSTCAGGPVNVVPVEAGVYEEDGEVKLLAPMPVQKGKGNAESCPCFTSGDPGGGPSPPTDNSAIGSYNPCTLRVRRLQLRECHKGVS